MRYRRSWIWGWIAIFSVGWAPSTTDAATLDLIDPSVAIRLGGFPALTVQSSNQAPISVSSGTGGFAVPASLIQGEADYELGLFTGVALISTINVTVTNQPQAFAAGAGPQGGFGGPGPLDGDIVLRVLGGLLNVNIPLSGVGQGGTVQSGAAALMLTVTGHAWTTGAISITGVTYPVKAVTSFGYIGTVSTLNTVTLSGFDSRSPLHTGSLLLVTPFRITTNFAGTLAAFALQRMNFFPTPEPGTFVLLATAAGVLTALGRKRRK